jgi:putative phage-type endonuclease
VIRPVRAPLSRQLLRTRRVLMNDVERHLARSGGRLACPHPAHRFAQVPGSPAQVILPECAGREKWLEARLSGIGGSEVAALVGVSEYETTFSIWRKKMATGPDEELTGAPIEWGHRLEEVVAQKVADELGSQYAHRFAGGLWADREDPVLRVTPDRLLTKKRSWNATALIECKTAGDDEHWESGTIHPRGQGTGSAPIAYQAQAQWQMGILGLPVCYLGCLVLGRERDFFTVEIHRDREWFAEMAAEAKRFWVENIKGETIPMHDLRHPRTEELLKAVSPQVLMPSTELPEGSESWLESLHRCKLAAEKAQADLDEAKNFFRMWTGDAGAAYLPREGKDPLKVVSYPEVSSTRVDVEKLRTEYPEVAEACTVRGSYRRLTITVPRDIKAKIEEEDR